MSLHCFQNGISLLLLDIVLIHQAKVNHLLSILEINMENTDTGKTDKTETSNLDNVIQNFLSKGDRESLQIAEWLIELRVLRKFIVAEHNENSEIRSIPAWEMQLLNDNKDRDHSISDFLHSKIRGHL